MFMKDKPQWLKLMVVCTICLLLALGIALLIA